MLARIPVWAAAALFCAAALYFTARGPWRANGSVNSYDFASVYGATRCWLKAENPYDMRVVTREVHEAGDDPATPPDMDLPPSIYLPTAFPVIAPIAWMAWKPARLIWSLLSIAAFAWAVVLILRTGALMPAEKWLLGAGLLMFSPTSSGLSTGNPGVIACAMTIAAMLMALEARTAGVAILLGLTAAMKPQIALAGFAVLAVWGCWRAIVLSAVPPVVAATASFVRAASVDHYRLWMMTFRQGMADLTRPGGMNDASPANYFSYHMVNAAALLGVWIRDPRVVSAIAWITTVVLAGAYLWLRRQAGENRKVRDIAFFCALCLVPIYHRYYDAEILFGVVPFLLARKDSGRGPEAAIWACLLVLLFPLQAMAASSLPNMSVGSAIGFVLLRHQPIVVLLVCVLLIPWRVMEKRLRA